MEELEDASYQTEEIQRRRHILQDIKECHYAIRLFPSLRDSRHRRDLRKLARHRNVMALDIDDLQETVERIKLEIRMTHAAMTIQHCYRLHLLRREMAIKDRCAKKIQGQWKVHRMRQFRQTIKQHKMHQNSCLI